MSRKKKIIIGIMVVVVLGAAAGANIYFRREQGPSVEAEEIRTRDLEAIVSASGKIEPKKTVNISAQTMGRVTRLGVQEGDRVRQGQILAILDDRDLAARRAQAHASLAAAKSGTASAEAERASADARVALARASHHRFEQLRERNSATPQEMDRATAELRMAEAGLRAEALTLIDEALLAYNACMELRPLTIGNPTFQSRVLHCTCELSALRAQELQSQLGADQ